ncbi:YegS/Rv2252/BmrU family lipid kinase [Phycisphaerales bacterium AB-hyl4]|uniref:YegS/Rv2252/BmrU family lipid kinase n=1 Tax=Natronomicrosphaera hydrolytica TaxID=3242702 RepID=A0ABV4U1C6_9BACT
MPASPRSLCLILNPRAAGDEQLRAAVHGLRAAGHRIEVRPTWESGQAEQFAHEITTHHTFDAIVVGGGDGTLNELVNGIMAAAPDRPPAVGVLPYGTANDFATGIGMPADDPVAALQLIATAPSRPIDLGRVNDRWFINAASVGLNAEITADTPKSLKQLLGGAAYSLNALTKLTTDAHRPATVTANSPQPEATNRKPETNPDLHWQGDMLMLIVANARTAGGGHVIAPHAQLDDGELDLTLVANAPAADLADVLTQALTTGTPHHPAVIQQRVTSLTVETEQPVTLNLDGEPTSERRCQFQVHPRVLPVLMGPRQA